MGFVGRLEDLGLADIFQILSLGKRSGKLTLTKRNQQGLIVFHNGGIIYCQSNTVSETLGSILVGRKMITESELLAALDRQQKGEQRPLGTILVGMGVIDQEALDQVVREQIENVLSDLLSWQAGVFQFEALDFPDTGISGFDANEFLVQGGISPEQLVLEHLTRMDENLRDEAEGASPEQTQQDTVNTMIENVGKEATEEQQSSSHSSQSRGFTSLKAVMAQLRQQSFSFTGEITLMLLRYAAEIVNRAVLFSVREGQIVGMGQFGLEIPGESADHRIRHIKIPCDQPSVLAEVVQRQEPYRGRLIKSMWNNQILQQLGGQVPREVVAIPVIVNGEAVAVIYGDNLPDDRLIGPIDGLELLMIEIGLVIEKAQLEARIREMERQAETA